MVVQYRNRIRVGLAALVAVGTTCRNDVDDQTQHINVRTCSQTFISKVRTGGSMFWSVTLSTTIRTAWPYAYLISAALKIQGFLRIMF